MGSWIDQELAGCKFADVRLEKRFSMLMEQLSDGIAPRIASEPLTLGVLRTPVGDFEIASGWQGLGARMPRRSAGFDIVSKSHVEGHAAAIMQRQGISEGILYINNPVICGSCTKNLPYMLGPGQTLVVVPLGGSSVPFTGVAR